jgi:DNA-binding transcriptional MocR family regulator
MNRLLGPTIASDRRQWIQSQIESEKWAQYDLPMLKYRALYEEYRALIEAGAFGPGERLPSLRRVCAESGLGLNTVRAAFDLLARDGLARPLERGGYYVRGGAALSDYEAPPGCRAVEGLSASRKIEYLLARGGASGGFALAEPGSELLPAARLERLLGSLPAGWIEYGDQGGESELRRRIAAAAHPYLGSSSPDEIAITCGATEAIAIAIKAVVRPGDAVAVESPTYYDYFRQLAAAGARVVEVPVAAGKGPSGGGMDLGLLESLLSKGAVRMIIAQPNVQNPTGTIMRDEDKERLVALARKAGAVLMQDDVYGDLAFSQERPSSLCRFGGAGAGRGAGLIYVSSFSKTLAPGLRIGWMRAPFLGREIARLKSLSSLAASRPAQLALASFLGGAAYRRHLAGMRASLESRLAEYLGAIEGSLPPGSSYARPAGGCLLWISLPRGVDASRVFEKAAAEDILIAPGELFSANPFFKGHVRVNFGHRLTQARREALARLCEIARDEARRAGRGAKGRRAR